MGVGYELGWVRYFVGWVGLGSVKWTHGQLWLRFLVTRRVFYMLAKIKARIHGACAGRRDFGRFTILPLV